MYKLPELSYLYQDLEPYIDTHTIGLHYHKHEQNYLNELNKILCKHSHDFKFSLEKLLFSISMFPQKEQNDILFNLGGVLNHNLYWQSMSKSPVRPKGKLAENITKKYGDFDMFWQEFKGIALSLKGAGYTFLVINNEGELDIINTSNEETPLFLGHIPLFTVDLWEHAYYLNYENDKSRYIDNFKCIADFTYANELYSSIFKW